jgi:hypothetical protein
MYSEKLFMNTIVTNVAVRHAPLYFNGARLIRTLATGPAIDQAGLFHTVFSFDGEISIGFTACREKLPDAKFYADCIEKSYEDLRSAVLSKKTSQKKKKARKKQAKKKPAKKAAPGKPATKKKPVETTTAQSM